MYDLDIKEDIVGMNCIELPVSKIGQFEFSKNQLKTPALNALTIWFM